MERKSTLVMAFDCFGDGSSEVKLANAMASVDALSRKLKWKRQPVAVVSPDQVRWPSDFSGTWSEEFHELGEKALQTKLKSLGRFEFAPEALLQPTNSVRASARALVEFANRKKASAVVCFSHIKKRNPFALPGNFVNSVIHHARVPVLVVNAQAPAVRSIKTIFVATDFSAGGARAFTRALELASGLSANLVLFHVMSTPVRPEIYMGAAMAGGWSNVEHYFEDENRRLRATGEKWVKKAWASGIEARLQIVTSSSSIASTVLKEAKKAAADLIVMAERTGPVEAFVAGSVTRDVLSLSKVPVLVMRTK